MKRLIFLFVFDIAVGTGHGRWNASGNHIGKKNGNVQLLWDFLSCEQAPRSTPFKFRVGYVF